MNNQNSKTQTEKLNIASQSFVIEIFEIPKEFEYIIKHTNERMTDENKQKQGFDNFMQGQNRNNQRTNLLEITQFPELTHHLGLVSKNKKVIEVKDKAVTPQIQESATQVLIENNQPVESRLSPSKETEEQKKSQSSKKTTKKWMSDACRHLRALSLLGCSRKRMVFLLSRNERLVYSKIQKLQKSLVKVYAILKKGLDNLNPVEQFLKFENVEDFNKILAYSSLIIEFKESFPQFLSEKIYPAGSSEKLLPFIPFFMRSSEFSKRDLTIILYNGPSKEVCQSMLSCIYEEIKAHYRQLKNIEQRVNNKLIQSGATPPQNAKEVIVDFQQGQFNCKKRDLKQQMKVQGSILDQERSQQSLPIILIESKPLDNLSKDIQLLDPNSFVSRNLVGQEDNILDIQRKNVKKPQKGKKKK